MQIITSKLFINKMKTMKKISGIFSMLFLVCCAVSCEDVFLEEQQQHNETMTRAESIETTYYYWYNDQKVPLTLNTEYVNVILDENSQRSNTSSSLLNGQYGQLVELQDGNILKLKLSNSLTRSSYSQTIEDLRLNQEVKQILPYFERDDAEPIGTSDIFYVQLRDMQDYTFLQQIAAETNVEIVKEVPYTPMWYILTMKDSSFESSIDASNYFYETEKFAAVDPAFMFDFQPNAIPNDPMFEQQWGLKNNSYSGIDINITSAWDITKGAGATVAVIDQGIDPNHNDLKTNFHSLSFNAKSGTSPSIYISGNNHGTHVAGIVGAVMNNNLQVTGVAPESEIMRVSHPLSLSSTTSAELASGINWAWRNGADVITNSWGDHGGEYTQLHSTILEQAITNAMTEGRNGLGCVVIFASGTVSATIDYPASFHDDILTVGSISSNGRRSSFSGYGSKLDVVAPGESILSTIPNNSTGVMSGTSMAAPHVAGIAALVIANNPTFTRWQVVTAIESTAQTLPKYLFFISPDHPSGPWTGQIGYGLVDAYAAINHNGGIVQLFDWTVSSNLSVTGYMVETQNVTVNNQAILSIISDTKTTLFQTLYVSSDSKLEIRN